MQSLQNCQVSVSIYHYSNPIKYIDIFMFVRGLLWAHFGKGSQI
jgi:hypothetical protein